VFFKDHKFEIKREADSIALIVKTLKQLRDNKLNFEKIIEAEKIMMKESQELIQQSIDEE
jgi:hypothetical protein